MPHSVSEICPGRLFAIGGSIPVGGGVPSWMPEHASGWLPMQCYVLRDDDSAIIIDTGTTVHRDEIRAGLDALLPKPADVRVLMTRREPDCSLNLDWIVKDFGIPLVSCGGDLNPLDFFASMDDASAEALITRTVEARFEFIRADQLLTVGSFQVDVLRPAVRVLSGNWLYERSTRTLFCSDFWGFMMRPSPSAPKAIAPAGGDITVDKIRDFTGTKFDWLRSIDTSPIIRELQETMERCPADRICPTYGCAIEGREAVKSLAAITYEAMDQLGRLPRASIFENFKLEPIR